MPEYPDYYLPDEPKKPSFLKNVWQIVKRDWFTLAVIALALGGWVYIIYLQTR